ncbi:uncharacterized protein E0L32_007100 [Thyridium curvatum]|uniref:Glutaminase GtaA n=1 Tax=Thyridium curvatum TaxID=1093900 RepID=A0A507B0I0_9PEZI|nr:uncharacterized protein E0L32_007100 [Thyridium curvatum]TPX12214.1 hypothetical protein E0L32_007100 [Thyridium curvatum]
MRWDKLGAILMATASSLVQAASTFTPARPPAIPLAVKSPYLNVWLNGDSGGNLPGSWPRFWTAQIIGWQGLINVDGSSFNWMGAGGGTLVSQTSFQYTSTKSIFTFDVGGKITMTVTFMSPVYPDDLVKQSLQFSYIDVKVKSADGSSHKVQVYMDISGELTSGDASKLINWDFETSNGVAYHKIVQAQPAVFSESHEQANWGNWYFATADGDGFTHKSGSDVDVRGQFAQTGKLDDGQDDKFRAVNDNWPVFGLSKDLGDVSGTEKEVLFTLGVAQDQVINFQGATDGPAGLKGLWTSAYGSDVDSLVAFHKDWSNALSYAEHLDAQIHDDSKAAAGDDYATITTLSVRQTFGALQVAQGSKQNYIFLKEISSNSDIQTVDVIFPAFPILLYLNATMGKLLLDPLYENQESGHYPNAWAIHDLGTFPNAIGYPGGNDEPMPLEECGNMVIMSLAYAQHTGDNGYLSAHWPKLEQWANFLVNDSLIPANQLSTDDFAGTLANQTNLALKGIIGLKAMGEIAKLTGNEDKFGSIADDYLRQWKDLGINKAATPPHTTLSYGDGASHGLLYNLYADRLLGLNFVGQEVYDMQSDFYLTVALKYGAALDTRHAGWTKADWEMYCAAIAGPETRAMFISKMATWIGETTTGRALTDLYDAQTGGYPQGGPTFVARPVMGGTFALLALPK